MSFYKEATEGIKRRKPAKFDTAEIFERAQQARNNGRFGEALGLYHKLRMGLRLRNPEDQDSKLAAACRHMIGVALSQRGDAVSAGYELKWARKEMQEVGDKMGEGAVLRDLGLNRRDLGDLEEAEWYLNESLDVLKETGNRGHIGMTTVKRGVVEVELGKLTHGMISIHGGIIQIESSSDRFFLSTAHWDFAKLLIKLENYVSAESEAQKSREVLDSLDHPEQYKPRRTKIDRLLTKLRNGKKIDSADLE